MRESFANEVANCEFIHAVMQAFPNEPEGAGPHRINAFTRFDVCRVLFVGKTGFELLYQLGGTDDFSPRFTH